MKFPPTVDAIETIFKLVLIAEIVLSVIATMAVLAGTLLINQEFSEAASETKYVASAISCFALVAYAPAGIASWVGLFCRWSWARYLYLGLGIFAFLMDLPLAFFDWSYQWSFPNVVINLACVANGLIIAIVFLTPVADTFSSPSRPGQSP